ncbi:MAG: hypothetical protein NTW50_04160 [Candidatus Berkelbacteria bacterium]|nr:hypothetical protein [Candidatus Berkelbacteria bacterium]
MKPFWKTFLIVLAIIILAGPITHLLAFTLKTIISLIIIIGLVAIVLVFITLLRNFNVTSPK